MTLTKKRSLFITLIVTAAMMWALTGIAVGQVDAPSATDDAPPANAVTLDEVNQVARELWCPLCSGVRLDACELKACDQMKEVIAIKLADGEDVDAIKAYFVDQYGPQVLGEPPREGFNWLAWILPVVVLIGGGIFLWRQMGRMMGRSNPDENSANAAAETTVKSSSSAAPAQDDDYERKLEEELSRHG